MTSQAGQVLQRAELPVDIPQLSVMSRWRALFVRFVPTPHKTPFTFGYLVVLLGTTALLRLASPMLASKLLEVSSTDAHNLWHRPLVALLGSAVWLSGEEWVPYAVIFAVAIAPLERRLGGWRTAGIFFSGHVLATLVTEVPIMVAISVGLLPKADGRWLDIGVSYGFFTTAGALVFLLNRRWRLPAMLLIELFIVAIYVSDDPASIESIVTVAGHAVAAHFGYFWWGPWLRRRQRTSTPSSPTAPTAPIPALP
ncbi:MAG: hypothetical protein JWQ81_5506 [Amycolatopsis sp.]|jgi:hypothetical protein|uniref:rhomboid-like protein n=1 Tax=Amycolatopsis sp. TaxID=37632 RepID=UPI00261236E8|nr:rhomboid-like protein [Amycolatopsis sp.]MCU1684767.1 hypothetical protein [Amycolatopsis sp.]